ncbi:MAG: response regulator [Bacteroidetes bacterium]|jgi:hypothetical protein|nr:response regulator [Bacteroidota bacterium]
MAVRSDIQQQAGEIARAKAAAKECLIAADKFLKDRQFDKARTQVDKAKEIDPSNPYISAFEERIKMFEEQLKSQPGYAPKPTEAAAAPAAKPEPTATPAPKSAPVPDVPKAPKGPAVTEMPKPAPAPEVPRAVSAAEALNAPPTAKPKPAAPAPEPVPPPKPARAAMPPPETVLPKYMPEPPASGPAHAPASDDLKLKMDEMSRQIMELSSALLSERRTREEILKKQLEASVSRYRDGLRKAWSLGAPKEKGQADLEALAQSLGLEDEVITSVTREIKLEMYGRAVKEMLAKRKLIRSSSSTMDWLRKVYQISMAEYLEYESKFLLDLVTDQFRGTLLLVAGNDEVRRNLAPRMKSSGFAVVAAITPEEALEKIERVSPTIVLTETQFPGRVVSGVMFLQLLRANPKFSFVPVILLCDEQEAVTLQSSELRDIEGVIRTPVDYDELNAMINEKLTALRNAISNI